MSEGTYRCTACGASWTKETLACPHCDGGPAPSPSRVALIYTAKPVEVVAWQWDGTPAGARAMDFPAARIERLSRSRGLIVIVNDREWLCLDPKDWLVLGHGGRVWVETDVNFRMKYQQQKELEPCSP